MCLQENNNIGPEGCKHLAPALVECKALTTLGLVRDADELTCFMCDVGCVSPPNSVFVWWWV